MSSSRNSYLKRKYGITEKNYNELLEFQNGRCAICGRLPGKTRLAVDHDHQTGEVRGLLNYRCNSGLLHYCDENPVMLLSAHHYLTDPPARKVLDNLRK